MQRSSAAGLPRRALINGGLVALSSAASGLKSSLQATLAPHLERLKEQDARYQQAVEQGADPETLARMEEEMRGTAGVIQGITDELTKMYDELVNAVYLIYSGMTGGEFADVVAAKLSKADAGYTQRHRVPDLSSTGLGLDHLDFRYADVQGKLDKAYAMLSAYEALAPGRRSAHASVVRSIGFQRVSGVYHVGQNLRPWMIDILG